jgi:exosortase A-associated hydrolase 1
MGDSTGEPVDFQTAGPDIDAALSALLQTHPGLRGVVLWGLCDGASAALLHLAQRPDTRVAGLCLVNPWVRTAAVEAAAQVQHYYRQRLLSPAFWRKLLRGGVGLGALRGWWRQWRLARTGLADPAAAGDAAAPFPDRMALGLRRFQGPTLCLLSGQDHTAREFEVVATQAPAWQGLVTAPRVTTVHHPEADHTHSGPEAGARLLHDLLQWLRQTGLHSPSP